MFKGGEQQSVGGSPWAGACTLIRYGLHTLCLSGASFGGAFYTSQTLSHLLSPLSSQPNYQVGMKPVNSLSYKGMEVTERQGFP